MLLGLFLFSFFLLILVLRFRVEIDFVWGQSPTESEVRFGIGRFVGPAPPRLLKRMARRIRGSSQGGLAAWRRSLAVLRTFVANFVQEIETLELDIVFGTVDPFWTVLGYSSIWTLLGPFLTQLGKSNKLKGNMQIRVSPHFQPHLALDFHCIFHFRLGQIIINKLTEAASALFAGKERKESG